MKIAIVLVFVLAVGCLAQSTTNISVTVNTNDLKYLPTNTTATAYLQKAADNRVKEEQRRKLMKAFDAANPAQRRALLNWIESNMQ